MDTLLSHLQPGEIGQVVAFRIGASPLRRRLLALGLLPGTVIEVKSRAPLGDPIEVRVRQTSLALCRHEAAALAIHRMAEAQ
ncbi:FeoA family protein [Chitinimonas lacunae]|uniref:FeoA family protein n=1 Tax=Chitinimonas lacunae TaxID=1963018 RepID=A0ABV8MP77_9NEIS